VDVEDEDGNDTGGTDDAVVDVAAMAAAPAVALCCAVRFPRSAMRRVL